MIKLTPQEVIEKIRQQIDHEEFFVGETQIRIEVDRYRRHDHGGGKNGENWLPEEEIDKDYQRGVEAHSDKRRRVNSILEAAGYKPTAQFDLGEKGHFSIYFKIQPIG